ncbi:unnamed protein product [Clavelina lepadiformis]|uniref:Uncharacterized protein n=1 Tax=Clavelina lepadiformis TaxID=159417 RepID=A0ABP0G9Z1_CLALP
MPQGELDNTLIQIIPVRLLQSTGQITTSRITDFLEHILQPMKKMKKLYLSINDLGDDGASHISTCLSKIEELDIGLCKISESGIKSISNAISKLPEPQKAQPIYETRQSGKPKKQLNGEKARTSSRKLSDNSRKLTRPPKTPDKRQKQPELYGAKEIARTRAQAAASAASSVAESLDPAPLLQPSSPIASQSTTRLQGPMRSRVHFYNSHSKDRS